jgi:hypothetical protein
MNSLKSRDKQILFMTKESDFPEFPFKPFNPQERLGKIADFTANSETERQSDKSHRRRVPFVSVDEFLVVDRKVPRKVKTRQNFAQNVSGQRPQANAQRNKQKDKQPRRDASIKILPTWKLLEEFDFNRMLKLRFSIADPVDV